jgi:hypothetical protein
MSKAAVSAEQMDQSGLSEEERLALEDDEETGEEAAADGADDAKSDGGAAAKAADDPDKSPQAAGDSEPGGAADPSKDDDKKADDDKAAAAADEDQGEEEETPDVDPKSHDSAVDTFRAALAAREIPEDLSAQLTANQEAIDALDKRLEDGEIDYAAHAKENRVLVQQMAELTALQREAEFVTANNEMSAQQHWEWEVERFVEENEQFKNPVVYGALRGALETLYQDPENTGNSYRWYLKTAAESVNDAFGISRHGQGKPTNTGDEDDADVTSAKALEEATKDADPVKPPPKTLGGTPEASGQEMNQDPFARLDDMDGMELEAALSKMSPADQQKYLDTRNY